MNDYQAIFVTPEQAVKAVQSGDWVDYGFGAGFPELLDKALAARASRLSKQTPSRRVSAITAGTSAIMSASSRRMAL